MKVLVVFHSVYGHVRALANTVAAGVQEVPDIELVLRRVREFPENVQHMEQEKGYRTRCTRDCSLYRSARSTI